MNANQPTFSCNKTKRPATMLVRSLLSLIQALAVIVVLPDISYTQGTSIIVEPKRLVLEGGVRGGSVTLLNVSPDTMRFGISTVDIEMTSTGDMLTLPDSIEGVRSARKMLRFFPREVVLAPNESQIVRIQVIKPAGLERAEYRSHLSFMPLLKVVPFEAANDSNAGVTMKLEVTMGLVIPVIYRNETERATTTLNDFRIYYDSLLAAQMISMKVERSGEESIYGGFRASFFPNGGGTPIQLGLLKGIGVYFPLTHRYVQIPINADGLNLRDGRIHVWFETYTGQGSETLLAESEFTQH